MKPGRRDGRDESEDLPLHEDFTPAGHGMESRMSVALFARFPHSVDFSGPGVAMSPRSVCFAAIFRTGGNIYGHEIEMYTVEQGEKRDKRQ